MTNLVFINKGKVVTDSLTVSVVFEKDHRNVLRDIEIQLEKLNEAGMEQWGVLNFEQTHYIHPQNKQRYPKYDLTEDAFAIVAMSYITPKAMEMKVKFLQEFKRMRMQLEQPQYKIPQTLPEALRLAADLSEENERIQTEKKQLEERIEADRPKVVFADSLIVSKDSILVSDLAKLLKQNGIDMGEKRLFQYLRDNGYLIKSGSEYNMPTQRSMEMKLFEIRTGSRTGSDGVPRITRTPKVTGKGQVYFINHFKKKGESA